MSLRNLLRGALRLEWLGEADAAVDRCVRVILPRVRRRRWWLAGAGGVALLFLVPFSLFALPPHLIPFTVDLPPNPTGPDVLQEHLSLQDVQLTVLQAHELADFNLDSYPPGTRDIHIPGLANKKKLLQLNQQQLQALQVHQALLRAQFSAPNSLDLPLSQLPLQITLQQQEFQRLVQQQQQEIRFARLQGHSKRYIRLLMQRQLQERLALLRRFQELDFRKTDQGTPFALRDLDIFDPLVLDFYPHPPGGTLDLDNDYDTNAVDRGRGG